MCVAAFRKCCNKNLLLRGFDEKVTQAVNDWDPLELFPYAPKDEYQDEIEELVYFLEKRDPCSADDLALKIYELFSRTLGRDVFTQTLDDCRQVAINILSPYRSEVE